MSGGSPGDSEHPDARFSRFQEKLGGQPVRRAGARDILLYDWLAEAPLVVAGSGRRDLDGPTGRFR